MRPEDLSLIMAMTTIIYLRLKGEIIADGLVIRWTIINLWGVFAGIATGSLILSDISIYLYFIKFYIPVSIYILAKSSGRTNKNELQILTYFIGMLLIWELYRYITKSGYSLYGRSPHGYEDAPLASGFYYILCQLIIYYIFVNRKILNWKFINIVTIIINIIILTLIINTGSKASIIMSVGILVAILYGLYFIRLGYNIIIYILAGSLILPFLIVMMLGDSFYIVSAAINRLFAFNYPLDVIIGRGNWYKIGWLDGMNSLLGGGYLLGHVNENLKVTFAMHYDNQILFNYLTGGIIGLILFFEFNVYIFRCVNKTKEYQNLVVIAFFSLAGIGAELWNLSLSSFTIFLFLGIIVKSNPEIFNYIDD